MSKVVNLDRDPSDSGWILTPEQVEVEVRIASTSSREAERSSILSDDIQEDDMKQITVFVEDMNDRTSKVANNKAINLSELESNVRASFYAQFPGAQVIAVPSDNAYIVNVWDEYVIVETGGDYYQVPYESSSDGAVTFVGRVDWQPVEKVWVEVDGKKAVSFKAVSSKTVSSKAKWTQAYVNTLDDDAFLYVEPGGEKDADGRTVPRNLRHLPYKNKNGNVDLSHLRNALSRLGQPVTGRTEEGKWLTEKLRKKLQEKARGILTEEQKELGGKVMQAEGLIGDNKARGKGQGVGGSRQGDLGADTCVCPKCGHEVEHRKGTPCNETECPKCGAIMIGSTDEGDKARGEGQGVGGPRQGDAGTDICVCPECGYEMEHKRGAPCNEVECPKCGSKMTGVTDAETTTARGEAGRTVIAGQAGEIESQVKGGPGSGNFGHVGRPGSRGGSAPGGFSGITNALMEHRDTALSARDRAVSSILDGYQDLDDARENADMLEETGNIRYTPQGYEVDAATLRHAISIAESSTGQDVKPLGATPAREWSSAQQDQAIDELSQKPLKDLRRQQDLIRQQISTAYEQHNDDALANLQTMELVVASAIDKQVFGDEEPPGGWDDDDDEKSVRSQVKAGRRVRSDKVSLIKRLAKEFNDLKDALMELVGWATYGDTTGEPTDGPPSEQLDMYDLLTNTSTAKALKQAAEHGSSFLTFKSSDDSDWLLTFTTNAFEDREEEIFTTKSIEDYVARHQDDDVKGEYQFWHLPGTKFGDIRWQGMAGRFLVEAGPFDDTPVGRDFKQFFNQYPDGHPDIAPEGWGCSHKYEYKSDDREDGVYEWFDKSETTVLPADVAANPHNPSLNELKGDDKMNKRQREALKVIGGDKLVGLVEEVGRKATEELEGTVNYKAKGDVDLPAQLQAIADGMEDEEAKKGVTSIIKAMRKMPPWLQGDEDEDEDEGEAEDEGKKPKDKKPKDKKEDPEPEPKKEEEEESATDETSAAVSDKEYQEAVAQSFVAIANHTDEQFAEVRDAIKELASVVKALKESDDVRIAEKAELTPAASLQEIVNSVIGHKDTRVDKRSQYHRDGPKQADPDADGPTPVPLLNMFISGEDQRQSQ